MHCLRESILRNCLIGNLPGVEGEVKIHGHAGDLIVECGGRVYRSFRAPSGNGIILPLPGGDVRILG
jgi:hypothetical protein